MPSNRDASIGPGIYVVAIAGIAYLVVILAQLPGASHRGDFSIYTRAQSRRIAASILTLST